MIGSIISYVGNNSTVWGTGAFGTEQLYQINQKAKYTAVRGPLTRQLLRNARISVPEVYGDPALLTPLYFPDPREKKYEIGLVLRWSERNWIDAAASEGVLTIDLGDSDVEKVLKDILSCKKIITSSLHGLIIADAYGIPSAFLASDTPKGGIFKFIDYFSSVSKFRKPVNFDLPNEELSIENLTKKFEFDERSIDFNHAKLLRACPFLSES